MAILGAGADASHSEDHQRLLLPVLLQDLQEQLQAESAHPEGAPWRRAARQHSWRPSAPGMSDGCASGLPDSVAALFGYFFCILVVCLTIASYCQSCC